MGILVCTYSNIHNSQLPTYLICRAYNVVFGLFQAPYYAFSQTMMAELTPPGFDNMVCVYIFTKHWEVLTVRKLSSFLAFLDSPIVHRL